jgi:hypothetical protein
MEVEYRNLKSRWLAGERSRELCLHLMYFAWMHWADPPFVTGLTNDPDAQRLWHDTFAFLGGENSTDKEFLFAAGIMAELFSYALGDENEWHLIGVRMRTRAMQPTLLPLITFDDSSKYGKYFAHQLRGHLDSA